MKGLYICSAIFLTACLTSSYAQSPSQPSISFTKIGASAQEKKVAAEHWNLSMDEIETYNRYMSLEGRFYYSHLDPVMVLGIIERDNKKRLRYAEMYLQAERERVGQQTSFANLVAAAQLKLYGVEGLFDFSSLPQAANHQFSGGFGKGTSGNTTAPPANNVPITPQSGDAIDLLIDPNCINVCYELLDKLARFKNVQIAIYGRGFNDASMLGGWMDDWVNGDPNRQQHLNRISLKNFDPIIFTGYVESPAPIGLLRRNGEIIKRL